jgi:hypothetical protein
MQTRDRHLRRWIAGAFVAAALAAPVAQATGPDDRTLYRGTPSTLAPTSQGTDDRSFYRGASGSLAPAMLSPDDRRFSRSVSEIEPRTVPVEVVTSPRGFAWRDAAIGGTFGLVLALLSAGALLIAHRRRNTLRTA